MVWLATELAGTSRKTEQLVADKLKLDQYLDTVKPATVSHEGSDFALGSFDSMRLVNVDMKSGGNLAVATLEDLDISSTRPSDEPNLFSAGESEGFGDEVFLYAHNLLSVNGLQFGERTSAVYMEAITIDLRNVTFPGASEVMLRSRDGIPTFGEIERAVGKVNFIENVKHGETLLEKDHFNGIPGKVNSTFLLPNGVPAVKIRAFSKANAGGSL